MTGAAALRFEDSQLSSLRSDSLSDSFARFTAEVLVEMFPGLHLFPESGKDGAIDFSADMIDGRIVGECKLVGSDSFADIRVRWREVITRLRRNITSPAGPLRGQSQYAPWYLTDPPICKYVFCTSAVIKNQGRMDQIKKEIREDLRDLGRSHPHLSHLSQVRVLVLDWEKLLSRASAHTRFRWFMATRPIGLVPITVSSHTDVGTFREYLLSDRMPYYSLKHHLDAHGAPVDSELLHEDLLVDTLAGDSTLGLLIAGAGGLGKTRLTLEIGRAAARSGWIVLRVHPPLRSGALDDLASTIDRNARVLLLFDYVETQPGFATLAERLYGLNATQELTIRYAANCRTSYLTKLSGIRDQKLVNLSPSESVPSAAWRRDYRRAAVQHILNQGGLGTDERGPTVAKDRPILAVLLAYLHATGRQAELNELLGTGDFGAWVSKRVELSFAGSAVTRDLALLCGLLPMEDGMTGLSRSRFQPLIDRFAADGWVERGVEAIRGVVWRAIHDVITDQVVVAYLSSIPLTTDDFARDLFDVASDAGSLDSPLICLQRLADLPQVQSIDWVRVLGASFSRAPGPWRSARGLLLDTSLLDASDVLTLLDDHDAVWEQMHHDPDIQDALGRLADRSDAAAHPLTDQQEATLLRWLTLAASAASTSNFALTRALRRCPERVELFARAWLTTHGLELQV